MNTSGRLDRADLAERAVVGAVLLNGASADLLADLLLPRDFAQPFERTVFERAMELKAETGHVDLIDLNGRLAADPVQPPDGWPAVISQLMDAVPHTADVVYHAGLVQRASVRRGLAELCARLAARSAADELGEVFADAENGVLQLQARAERTGPRRIGDEIAGIYSRLCAAVDGRKQRGGLNCGFPAVHRITGEWGAGDLIVLAARPSIGKSALGMGIAQRCAAAGVYCVVFSLEMTAESLIMRLVSGLSGVDSRALLQYEVNQTQWPVISSAIYDLSKLPIAIDDRPGLTPLQMRAVVSQLNIRQRAGLIVVDYLQLAKPDKGGLKRDAQRYQEIGEITRSLKAAAKHLQCPVLVLAQLSRKTEERPDKRPQVSDLRESGDIENDADKVLLIHRPEHYKIERWPDGTPTENSAEIIVGKNRNGPVGSCRIGWHGPTVTFSDEPIPAAYQPEQTKETRRLY